MLYTTSLELILQWKFVPLDHLQPAYLSLPSGNQKSDLFFYELFVCNRDKILFKANSIVSPWENNNIFILLWE